MKNVLIFLGLLLLTINVSAQGSVMGEIDNNLLQKYIDLAKQNYPKKVAVAAREVRAKSSLNAARLSWLDAFNANYYWNPQNRNDSANIVGGVAANNQIMQRGFLAGVSVNLGTLLAKPSTVKAAKAEHEAAQAENREYFMTLATEVKSRYYDYLLAKKQLALNNVSLLSSKTIFSDAKTKFESGQITIDQYTVAKTATDQSEAILLASEVTYLKAKNALEDMIGEKLENVK